MLSPYLAARLATIITRDRIEAAADHAAEKRAQEAAGSDPAGADDAPA